MTKIIKTMDDWWCTLESNWSNILDIFDRVGAPMGRSEIDRFWSDGMGKEPTQHEYTLIKTLEVALEEKDHETLKSFFEKAWMAAPDKPYIHSWPGWSALCDLCSEYWVFDSYNYKT